MKRSIVRDLRDLNLSYGYSLRAIGTELGVSSGYVCKILKGRTADLSNETMLRVEHAAERYIDREHERISQQVDRILSTVDSVSITTAKRLFKDAIKRMENKR